MTDEKRPVRGTEAVIDLPAITSNAAVLKRTVGDSTLMAVVKADGYGHGAAAVARAALAGGAEVIGVATPSEALALRDAGIDAPTTAWLWPPAEDVTAAVDARVQLGVPSTAHLAAVVDAAHRCGRTVEVHLIVDTGLGRNGATMREVGALADAAARAQADGGIRVIGVMSHLASADIPGDESVAGQLSEFRQACARVDAAGLEPRWRHIANTAAALNCPKARLSMVRCGIGLYGLPPVAGFEGFRPAMTLRTTVALTKKVPAGAGVGYGLTYHTPAPGTLALIPIGYGDGLPRVAGNVGELAIGGRRYRIAGRVAMDQVVVDCGDDEVHCGDEVLVFGPGDSGEPTATEWATYSHTIDYEIVTRIGPRVPRRYLGATDA